MRITPHIFKVEEQQKMHVNVLPGDYLYDDSNPDFKPTTTLPASKILPQYLDDNQKSIHRIIIRSNPPNFFCGHKFFIQNIDINQKFNFFIKNK